MIEIWGRRSSVNVQKVLWAVAELGLPFERRTVGGSFGGTGDAAYLRMNPNGLVPVIRDGDIVMFESNAIVRYLSARHGEGKLRPADPRELAAAEQWMEWQQTTVAPLIGAIFLNQVRLKPGEGDAKAVAAAAGKMMQVLPIADARLAKSTYFTGEELSFGDIVLGCLFWRYSGLDCEKPDLPNLKRWFETLKERPAYREWVMVPVGRNPAEWDMNERALG